ncbi:MAG: DUF4956 domain-containing protein [Bacteroidales bacterium]|nr:DUF4956 domain-containing protein [Bacteroidales bacterium]
MLLQLPEFDPSIAEEFGYDAVQGASFLGVQLFDSQNLLHLFLRFGFNLLASWIIVQFLYYRKGGRKDYYLTFMMFASAMFLLIFLMESVKLQIGLTLGLFAIFGVIRYRTETVPVREMTYLFVIITVAVINGLALNITYAELIVANLLLIALIAVLEYLHKGNRTSVKLVCYDRIENIVPERREDLIADLKKRLGVEITDVEIGHVDFLKDSAFIKVTYVLPVGDKVPTIESITRAKDFNE